MAFGPAQTAPNWPAHAGRPTDRAQCLREPTTIALNAWPGPRNRLRLAPIRTTRVANNRARTHRQQNDTTRLAFAPRGHGATAAG
eukprot:80637-Lingulodinium_polyedra.AAC.1